MIVTAYEHLCRDAALATLLATGTFTCTDAAAVAGNLFWMGGVGTRIFRNLDVYRTIDPALGATSSSVMSPCLSSMRDPTLHSLVPPFPESRSATDPHWGHGGQRFQHEACRPAGRAADWTLLASTPLWDSLFLRPPATEVPGQNLVIDTFVTMTSMLVADPHGGMGAFERALVADLRRTAAYAGNDPGFASLIATLHEQSPRFAELWGEGNAAAHQSLVQTVNHPVVGEVTVDCDTLTVPDFDLRIIVCTAAAGSPAAEQLARLQDQRSPGCGTAAVLGGARRAPRAGAASPHFRAAAGA
jgi:hypothetical protein